MRTLAVLFVGVLLVQLGRWAGPWERLDGETEGCRCGRPVEIDLAVRPWDTGDRVQGIEYSEDLLFLSKGGYGHSRLEMWRYSTGELLSEFVLPSHIFAEGVTIDEPGMLLMATWREAVLYRLAVDSDISLSKSLPMARDLWGVAARLDTLFITDGTTVIRRYILSGLTEIDPITVTSGESDIDFLNHLDFHKGQLVLTRLDHWEILLVDPRSGQVSCRLGLESLRDQLPISAHPPTGIASGPRDSQLLVTGKGWNSIARVGFCA